MLKQNIATKDYSIDLTEYKTQMDEELLSVLNYWKDFTVDEEDGGFFGSVSNENIPDKTAPKGIVLNSRILWTFSAGFLYSKDQQYLRIAERAFQYIIRHFTDPEFGGVYWSVDYRGKMLDGKKQIYGLAFCIYGMSEYYKATHKEKALTFSKELFEMIEKYSYDKKIGGYLEAFTRDWQPISDLRLSEKDDNEKITANTHLHIIEAYANLYLVWPDEALEERISTLLKIFSGHFIRSDNYHLNLFFDEHWAIRSSLVSYGHDIEAAWLLLRCAEILGNEEYINEYKQMAVKMTDAAAEALDSDGGLWYEYEAGKDIWVKEKHSWSQAEAMIGFLNAWQISGKEKYLQHSLNSWEFIKRSIKNHVNGEWFWGIEENGSVMKKEKAGFWKCPYHSTRAFLEIINRIKQHSI